MAAVPAHGGDAKAFRFLEETCASWGVQPCVLFRRTLWWTASAIDADGGRHRFRSLHDGLPALRRLAARIRAGEQQRRVPPNPYSPYADGDPGVRHVIESFLGRLPDPGDLTLAVCGGMVVVPEEPLQDLAPGGPVPEGMCPVCVELVQGGLIPNAAEPGECEGCGEASSHGDLCALCRREQHNIWWMQRVTI